MPTGTVKNIRQDKGFGFIEPQGPGGDLFFHYSQVTGGLEFDEQLIGRRVSYDADADRLGRPRALNVRAAD